MLTKYYYIWLHFHFHLATFWLQLKLPHYNMATTTFCYNVFLPLLSWLVFTQPHILAIICCHTNFGDFVVVAAALDLGNILVRYLASLRTYIHNGTYCEGKHLNIHILMAKNLLLYKPNISSMQQNLSINIALPNYSSYITE